MKKIQTGSFMGIQKNILVNFLRFSGSGVVQIFNMFVDT